MQFGFFRRTKKSKTINYLTLTPLPLIASEINSDGTISLLVPRFKSKFWSKHLMTKTSKKHIRLNLDELGSSTWSLIDGTSTVGEICDRLEQMFGERIHPVEDRVTKYISGLYLNHFLTFKEVL